MRMAPNCMGPFSFLVEAAGIEPASCDREGKASTRVSQVFGLASGSSPEPDLSDASPLGFPRQRPGQSPRGSRLLAPIPDRQPSRVDVRCYLGSVSVLCIGVYSPSGCFTRTQTTSTRSLASAIPVDTVRPHCRATWIIARRDGLPSLHSLPGPTHSNYDDSSDPAAMGHVTALDWEDRVDREDRVDFTWPAVPIL